MNLTPKQFVKRLEKTIDRVDKRLEAYLWDQNSDNTHDLRIGIRRVETAFNLLPNKVRSTHRVKAYLKSGKDFFKTSTKSRDIDTILKLIENYEVPDDDSASAAISNLLKQRTSVIKEARKAAQEFQQRPKPYFKKGELAGISKRVSKKTAKLAEKVNSQKHAVLDGYASSSEDLHSLRKNCKKLRYSLELVQSNRGKESITVQKLSNWQDSLGLIHDLDVTIEFLKGLPSAKEIRWSEPILAKLLQERRKSLEELLSSARKDPEKEMLAPIRVT